MRTRNSHTLVGVLFGLAFPVVASMLTMVSHDGSLLHLHLSNPLLLMIDTAPLFLGLAGYIVGLRQEKIERLRDRVEADLEHLFDSSHDLIALLDQDGRIIRFNMRMAQWGMGEDPLALSQLFEAQGLDLRTYLQPQTPNSSRVSAETTLQNAGGSPRAVLWDFTVGLQNRFLAMGRDITELRQKSASLQQYADKLQSSLHELDQLAYSAAHDLRSPLRAIHTLADFMQEDLEKGDLEAVNGHMEKLRKRIHRMRKLLDGVQLFAVSSSTNRRMETIHLRDFVAGWMEQLSLPESLSVDASRLDLKVTTNPNMLRVVLDNLLQNVVDHCHKDDLKVEIAAEESPDSWIISFTDNGPGIPAMYHEKVFELFRTLNAPHAPESSGIGLSVARKMVQAENGTLRIDPSFQEGTRMLITLPR